MRKTLQEQCLFELLRLDEATRTQLVAQSRNAGEYKIKNAAGIVSNVRNIRRLPTQLKPITKLI